MLKTIKQRITNEWSDEWYSQFLSRGRDSIVQIISCVLKQLFGSQQEVTMDQKNPFNATQVPSIGIDAYFQRIARFSKCSSESLLTGLYHVNQIVHYQPTFQINALNIHRLLLVSIMCSSKFVDDKCYNNATFATIGGVSSREINKLEREYLSLINYELNVSPRTFGAFFQEISDPSVHSDCVCHSNEHLNLSNVNIHDASHASPTKQHHPHSHHHQHHQHRHYSHSHHGTTNTTTSSSSRRMDKDEKLTPPSFSSSSSSPLSVSVPASTSSRPALSPLSTSIPSSVTSTSSLSSLSSIGSLSMSLSSSALTIPSVSSPHLSSIGDKFVLPPSSASAISETSTTSTSSSCDSSRRSKEKHSRTDASLLSLSSSSVSAKDLSLKDCVLTTNPKSSSLSSSSSSCIYNNTHENISSSSSSCSGLSPVSSLAAAIVETLVS